MYMGKKYQKLKRYILDKNPDINPKDLDKEWIKLNQKKSYKKKTEDEVIVIQKDKRPIIKVGGEYKDRYKWRK